MHCYFDRTVLVVIVIGFAVLSSGSVDVHADESAELQLQTQRVVVFKDGYALVVKRGIATADADGNVFTDDVPDAAVLGSFWAVPTQGRLLHMRADFVKREESVKKAVPATTPLEILEANLGSEGEFSTQDQTFSGRVVKVLTKPATTTADENLLSMVELESGLPRHRQGTSPTTTIANQVGSYFIIENAAGQTMLPVDQLRRLAFRNMKTTVSRTLTTKVSTKRLSFRFDAPNNPCEMLLMYFRPGIRWIPTYRLTLAKDNKAAEDNKAGKDGRQPAQTGIALQGELLNEAEDLVDTPIDLVVGVPNFRFREIVSPLVLEQTLRQSLREAAPQIMGRQSSQMLNNGFSNSLFTQRSGEFHRHNRADANAGRGAIQLPQEFTAGGAQDLFVYHMSKLSLEKGSRAAVPIFTGDVPYSDIYTWNVRMTRQANGTARTSSVANSPLQLAQNEVWHQLELTNNTDVPWTTGAVMILQDHLPLAQELLTYTSKGAAVRVPVTVAIDVRGTIDERELSRDVNGLRWEGNTYAKIEKQAKLRLTNNKAEAVRVEITYRVGGKATAASDDGDITLRPYDAADWNNFRGDPSVNNSSTIRWSFDLDPGQSVERTATYHYYSR